MFNTQGFLKSLSGSGRRIMFYPSAGNRHGWIIGSPRFDYDLYIFGDYRSRNFGGRIGFWRRFLKSAAPLKITMIAATPISRVFRFGEKIGIYFFLENMETLDRIRRSGHKIDCFIGYICGCGGEGGGTYCTGRAPYLAGVLQLIPKDGTMRYVSDHGMMFSEGGWGHPDDMPVKYRFGESIYEFTCLSDKVPGLNRAHEFKVQRKSQTHILRYTEEKFESNTPRRRC